MAKKPQETEMQADVEVIEATSNPPVQVKSKIMLKKEKERAII